MKWAKQQKESRGGKQHIKSFPLWLLYWLALGIFGALFFNAFFLLQEPLRPVVGAKAINVLQQWLSALGFLLGAGFCFACLRQGGPDEANKNRSVTVIQLAQYWVPLWIGFAFFAMSMATGMKAYLAWISPGGHVPYWTNCFELARYPSLLLAIFCLPSRSLSPSARFRLVLDGLLINTALMTFGWYFLLGPLILFNGYPTLLDKLIGEAFPFGDLLLCYCLLRLVIGSHERALQPTRWLLLGGLTSLILAGSINAYQIVHASRPLETWLTAAESTGYLFMALAVLALHRVAVVAANEVVSFTQTGKACALPERRPDPPFWQTILPSLFVPAVGALVFFTWRSGTHGLLAQGVYLGSALLLALLLLRQAVFIHESYIYNKVLYAMQSELYSKTQRLEEQAQELTQAYQQQRELNETKDQLLLNVSHELRTPLTELNGYLELLQMYQGNVNTEMQKQFIEHAMHGSGELLHLVNTFLDALRSADAHTALHLEEARITDMVQRALDVFEPQKWRDYQLTIAVPEYLTVRADRQYIHQILCNLLSNALKYSPPHTAIEVGADVRMVFEQEDEEAGETAREICIWVRDHGPGIAPKDIPLLFEKFARLERDRAGSIRGTGLGLYICKQLISAMGGRIWVESSGNAGQGSRFCFTLPCSSSSAPSEQSQPQRD